MKLLYAPPSPYSRKVRVLARELDLMSGLEEIAVVTTPVHPSPDVTAVNPLSKIPTLVLDDGSSLYDSRVIADYLLSLRPGQSLLAAAGSARWNALRRQALADGLLDAALLVRYEQVLRPADKHWQPWLDSQHAKLLCAVAALEGEQRAAPASDIGLDSIAIACAMSWVEFRMPELGWRTEAPSLAGLLDACAARTSMRDTDPRSA